ncbi:double-strand break repair helicase AddA [Teichococcus vastitatis]|uniref:double-strand break repair helicase AddA n=1 Tax=Teichococcus vastitatis TaxID=2307076 RepID=UPI001EE3DABA|nr:double-strand break repair helicase AddA [Pseudoroseomonas vastitatis]
MSTALSPALSPRAAAQDAQRRASDPVFSAWVGASAGSGKTKVLTDRVLRLLLRPGARPNRLLCLTFTKAAAAEMATRLARRLGEWAVAEEMDLDRSLLSLTGSPPDAELRSRARGLFAAVLDLPGGMRINTIHAFCQSLLRGFPLEAGLPPQFRLVEESDANAMLAEAREAALSSGRLPLDAIEAMAGLGSAEDFADTLRTLVAEREKLAEAIRASGGLAGCDAALRRRLGLPRDGQEEEALHSACARIDTAMVRAAGMLAGSSNENDQRRGAQIRAWVALAVESRVARWEEWSAIFLTTEGSCRKSLATKGGLGKNHSECQSLLAEEAERVREVEETRKAWRLHRATLALLALAQPVLDGYAARKSRIGAVDFDDLIQAARRLLQDPGSAWVLYKLDGGLDHLLLDEAQDSNSAQWDIAARLAEEFFAGQGTREDGTQRTIFAVGDEKQSIYSFQGADAAGFARWEQHFAQAVAEAEAQFTSVPLNVSFRSTAPVLALVDAVFSDGAARRGVIGGNGILAHRADREGEAGLVEIWPPLAPPDKAELEPWQVPDEPVAEANAMALLAESLAARIARMIREERLPARGDRPIRPGDILVLLRRRTAFSALLVRALKARGVPVGGLDRLRLIEQIAVQDLLALCDVLLLPEDDLQLAAVLKSPLCNVDEAELFTLSTTRGAKPLWWRLMAQRGSDTPAGRAAEWLADLSDRADLATPHTILAEVLGEHGGRGRMLERLGPDAADPLDEVLNAALMFEARYPPSLQGFVHWLRRGGAEVKREAESGVDAVRLMTAHGAKGLQAPVVILPDVGSGRGEKPLRWDETASPAMPLWAPRSRRDFFAPAWSTLMESDGAARDAEENRLLYVALTRAEDRLLVCAWGDPKPGSWYDLVAQGFTRLHGAREAPFEPAAFNAPPQASFSGPLRWLDSPQTAAPRSDAPHVAGDAQAALPEWVGRPAPPESEALTLSPSALPGEEQTPTAAPHGRTDPTGDRFRRGRLIHALLQHLPDTPDAERDAVAMRFLRRPGHGLSPEEQDATAREVLTLMRHPRLRDAFGPDSLAEAPVAGRLAGHPLAGQVDRMLIQPDRVVVLDYKTNRPPPEEVSAVDPLYLRQMAAYRGLLRQVFPDRRVECWLLWTWAGRVMELPDAVLDRHAPR